MKIRSLAFVMAVVLAVNTPADIVFARSDGSDSAAVVSQTEEDVIALEDGDAAGDSETDAAATIVTEENESESSETMIAETEIEAETESETEAESDDFTIVDGVLTAYTGSDTAVEIPEGVIEIGANVFKGMSIKSVAMPDSVTAIGDYAFYRCSSLSDITFSENLTSIGNYAFYYCFSIDELELPEGLVSIGNYAFYWCSDLTRLSLPDSLKEIGDYAFYQMGDSYYWITYDEFYYEEYYSYEGETMTLELPESLERIGDSAFRECHGIVGDLVFPAGLQYIGNYAFYECDGIDGGLTFSGADTADETGGAAEESVPDVSLTIGSSAFSGCTSLTGSLVFPDTLTSIGNDAFYECENLDGELKLSENLETIGKRAFYWCRDLTGELEFSDRLTSIGDSAFYQCRSLTGGLDFPESLTSIGSSAFGSCSGLDGSLTLPDTLSSIGSSAFSGCSGLTGTLTLPGDLTAIGSGVFSSCSKLSGTLVIPDSVKTIASSAFNGCSGFSEIVFGTGITNIYGSSSSYSMPFYGCTGITKITFTGESAPVINSSLSAAESSTSYVAAFFGSSCFVNLTQIVVPDGCYLNYAEVYGAGLQNQTKLIEAGWEEQSDSDFIVSDSGVLQVYLGSDEEVVIPDGVTEIGSNAFLNNPTLKSVTIHEKVTKIGSNAFKGCASLTEITIPDSVKTIESAAFKDCTALLSASLPASLTGIEDYLFYGCTSLEKITVPSGVTDIGSYAFYNCSSLGGIAFPSGVVSIGSYAFYNCSSIAGTLELPSGITGVETYTFYGCAGLTAVDFPSALTDIGAYAFAGCTGLDGTLTLESGLESIGNYAFKSCTGLDGVVMRANPASTGVGLFSGCTGLTAAELNSSMTKIASSMFSGCTGLSEVSLPSDSALISIGSSAFYNCTSLNAMPVSASLTSIGSFAFYRCTGLTGTLSVPDTVTDVDMYAFYGCTNLTGLVLSESLTEISEYVFGDCAGLTGTLTIPDSVKTIDEEAFYRCTGLTEIIFGAGITRIVGYYEEEIYYGGMYTTGAFYGCTGVTSVTFRGETVPEITQDVSYSFWDDAIIGYFFGSNTFAGLTKVVVPLDSYTDYMDAYGSYLQSSTRLVADCDDDFAVKDGVLIVYNGTASNVTVPGTVSEIGPSAFKSNTTLTQVTLSSGITSIGKNAFTGCTSLTKVTLSNTLETIGDYAFYGCTALTTISGMASAALVTIGNYAFSGCTKLTGSLSFPSTLTSIGNSAFYGCSAMIGTLSFSTGLKSIGSFAFYNCAKLTGSLTLPKGLESIGNYAFYKCSGLTGSLSFPTGLEKIGGYAFEYCTGLTGSLVIPDGVTSLESGVFYGCTGFTGTLTFPDDMVSIGVSAFYGCKNLKGTLTLPSGLTSIGSSAFYGCSGFTGTLTLPKSLTTLGSSAFRGCTGLTGDLTIPSGLSAVANSVFYGCTGFKGNLILPEGLTEINSSAFYGCTGLSGALELPKTLKTIDSSAFYGCTGFTGDLTVPNRVTTLGSNAFYGCTGFNGRLTLSEKLTAIENNTFRGCTGLSGTLSIPDSVRTVGMAAFVGCTGLSKIVFGSGLTNIWSDSGSTGSFYGCSGVKQMTFTGSEVPVINNSVTAAESDDTYITEFFGTGALPGLQAVFVLQEYLETYKEAWEALLPEGAVISYGLDLSVSGLNAEYVYSHSVSLAWTASVYDEVIGYHIYRDGVQIADVTDTSYIDTGLDADETYEYSVAGYTDSGDETEAAALAVVTSSPQVLSVYTGDERNKVVLLNNYVYASVKDTGNLESASGVFWYLDEDGARVRIGKKQNEYVSKSGTTAVYMAEWDLTDTADGDYTVIFELTDADGETGAAQAEINVDTSRPRALTGVVAVGDTNQIVISWEQSYEADTTRYYIYRRAEDEDDFTRVKVIYERDTLTWTDTGGDTEKKYYYYVVGVDPYGLEGEQSDIVVAQPLKDTEAPTVVQLTPVNGSRVGSSVELYAQAKDKVAVTQTRLYLSADDGETWELLESTDANYCSYTLSTAEYGDISIQIKGMAYDAAQNESSGLTYTYTIDNTGPDKVTGLALAASTATTLTLSWNDVEASDFSYFRVEQKLEDGTWKKVQDVYTTLGINIYNLQSETDYTYRVAAYDQLGNRGEESEELTVSTQPDTTAPVITSIRPTAGYYNGTITLQITATDNTGIASILVQTSTDAQTWEDYEQFSFSDSSTSKTLSKKIDLSETDESGEYLFAEGNLYIRGVATDIAGNEGDSSNAAPYVQYIIDRTAPETPQDFAANTETTGAIELTWTQGGENDLADYRLYRSTDGETYTLLAGGLYSVNYWDRSVEAGVTYWYRLAVADTAGNISEQTESISAMVVTDTEAPAILSYAPESGSIIGTSNAKFSVLVSDNWKVDSVKVTYTVNDSETVKTLINSTGINTYYKLLSESIPLSSLSDGDVLTLSVTVKDAQGLTAVQDGIIYTIDKTAPRVESVTAEGDYEKITVSWTGNAEEDLAGYRIYRKTATGSYSMIASRTATGATEFQYEDYNAQTKQTYYYKVEAVDSRGNTHTKESEAAYLLVEPSVTASLSCGSDLAADREYYFDASASAADLGIASYQFDFGDGTESVQGTASKVTHVYTVEGSYTVTLTVTDAAGTTAAVTRTVTVTDPDLVGTVRAKVVDGNGNVLSGVPVYFDLDNTSDNTAKTDVNGYAEFTAHVGSYSVGSYVSGYLPVKKTVAVGANAVTNVELTLVESPIVTGEFEITRMTLDEIIAAGIDVTDPANQNVVTVTVHLTYGSTPVTVNVVANDTGIISNPVTIVDTSEGRRALTVTSVSLPKTSVGNTSEDDEEDEALVAIMDIPVEISYLKEFFDVKLHIFNHASTEFELTSNEVTLNVPEGLALVDSNITNADATITFDSLKGQEEKTVEWIVRGDEAGEYTLSADYSGILSYFNEVVTATFVANEPITVYGLNAIKLGVEVGSELDDGDLYFNLSMENTSDVDIYLPSIDVLDNLISVYESSEEAQDGDKKAQLLKVKITDAEGESRYLSKGDSVRTLAAGETYTKQYACYDVVSSSEITELKEAAYSIADGMEIEVEITESDSIDTNRCGDNLTWKLKDGVLEIAGEGFMMGWVASDEVPWQYVWDEVTSIMVGTGVTAIGNLAFSECVNATTVRIPNTMQSIFYDAFDNCSSLEDVYYCSTEDDWAELEENIYYGNDYLLEAELHCLEFDKDIFTADLILQEDHVMHTLYNNMANFTSPGTQMLEQIEDVWIFNASIRFWDSLSDIYSVVSNPFTIRDVFVSEKDLYSVVLLDALEAIVSYDTVSTIESYEDKAGKLLSVIKGILETDYYWTAAEVQNWSSVTDRAKLEEMMTATEKAFKKQYPNLTFWDEVMDDLGDILEVCKTTEDYIEKCSQILVVIEMDDSMRTVLGSMYDECSDSALRSAIEECISYVDSGAAELILRLAGDGLVEIDNLVIKRLGKQLWKEILNKATIKGGALSTLLLTYKSTTLILDACLDTDDVSDAYGKLRAIVDVEELADSAAETLKKQYVSSGSSEDAAAWLAAIDMQFQVWDIDCVYAYNLMDVVDSSTLYSIAKFFNTTGSQEREATKVYIADCQKRYMETHEKLKTYWLDYANAIYYGFNLAEMYSYVYEESEERLSTKTYLIACPVDVYVYDTSDTLVASVIDNKAWSAGDIGIVVEDETKLLYFYDNEEYTIRCVGSDEGSMDITVTEYDSDGETEVREVHFYDVPLTDGQTYEIDENGQTLDDEGYALTELADGTEIVTTITPDLDTLRDNIKRYTVIVRKGYLISDGNELIQADVFPGETLEISANVPDGYQFEYWTSDLEPDTVLFADANSEHTTVTMPDEDVTIRAIFSEINEEGGDGGTTEGGDGGTTEGGDGGGTTEGGDGSGTTDIDGGMTDSAGTADDIRNVDGSASEGEHTHSWSEWKTAENATVFKAETQIRTCSTCGAAEYRSYGSALTPAISVNASSIKLQVKQSTTKLVVSGLANGDSIVSWKSSNKKIVTVTAKGKIKAKNKTGKATVTITLASGLTKKIKVTVQKKPVKTTKISGLTKKLTLTKREKYTLHPVILPITSVQKVKYSSSDRKVLTVNAKGVITAKRAGKAKVTVKSGTKKYVITVTVTDK